MVNTTARDRATLIASHEYDPTELPVITSLACAIGTKHRT